MGSASYVGMSGSPLFSKAKGVLKFLCEFDSCFGSDYIFVGCWRFAPCVFRNKALSLFSVYFHLRLLPKLTMLTF